MGPGPSDVHPRVLGAMGKATIGHLDPEFVALMEDIKELLRYCFKTKNTLTLPLSAPVPRLWKQPMPIYWSQDKAIVCINGVFGMRMAENVRRMGGELVTVEDEWGTPVSADKLKAALQQHPDAKIVGFVHAETSTGVCSDAKTLCALAQEAGCLTIVDSVTGFGWVEVLVDEWGADVTYSGTQKCLSAPPGNQFDYLQRKSRSTRAGAKHPVQSWFLDLSLLMAYWQGDGARTYHHTAPVNAMYGLHEALLMVQEEGLENSWQQASCHA